MKNKLQVPNRRYGRVFAPDLSAGMNAAADSRVLPFGKGELAVNVCVKSGALTGGYGIRATDIPGKFHKVYYYNVYDEVAGKYRGYYLAHNENDGKIYIRTQNGGQWNEIAGTQFATAPFGVNYRLFGEDVYLLCGEEGMTVIYPNIKAVNVPSAPEITGITMHNERMFVTVGGRRNAIWFSDDLNPTNWNPELDEGGFIEMEGESGRLIKAVSFGGYVYVFREYGIARLIAYGDQSEFSISNLFVSSGKIYGNTVCVCGDRILFLASDGIYSFDGLATGRIARNLDGYLKPDDKAAACYCDGKYFLSASSGGDANGVTVVIDPRDRTMSVNEGLNVKLFSPVTDGCERLLVKTDNGYLGEVIPGEKIYGENPVRIWQSGFTDLGLPDCRKLITEVYLDTEYDCTVTVTTERGSKTLKYKGKNESQRKRVNLIGTKVRLRIEACGDISIARPAVKYCKL